jgi:hypothetical protein
MAQKLFENNLAIIGTLRQNKIQIPPSFLPNNSKEVYSSQFAYDKYLTLVSYTRKVFNRQNAYRNLNEIF